MAAQRLTKHYQKPWQLIVSVCLTRQNKLAKDLTDIEKRYAQMIEEIEYENSVLNDYEARKRDLKAIVNAPKSTKMSEKEEEKMTEASRLLAGIQDQEDMWQADASKITVQSKHQEKIDKDTKSHHRLLDSSLHMVIRDDQLLKESSAVLPYTVLNDGETLRQASERLLSTFDVHVNDTLYLSNAPAGVVKIRYQEDEERGKLYQGAKVFFTKVHATSLENHNTQKCEWLTINEIGTQCQTDYFERVKKFI